MLKWPSLWVSHQLIHLTSLFTNAGSFSKWLCWIDLLQWSWLTGDLTNHNAESPIFVQKTNQTGGQINIGGLELEKYVRALMSFCDLNKIPSDVHACLFCTLSKYEKIISSHAAWTEALQSRHIKEPQNGICCLNFFKKCTKCKSWDYFMSLVCRHVTDLPLIVT